MSLSDVLQALAFASPGYLILAFMMHIIGLWISAYRWHVLLRVQNIQKTQYDLAVLYLIGFFYNTFLPGSFSGDVVRAYKASAQKLKSAAVLVLERGSGIFCLFLFVSIVSVFSNYRIPDTILVKPFIAPMAVGTTVLILAVFYILIFVGQNGQNDQTNGGYIRSKFRKFHSALGIYRDNRRVLSKVFGLSFLLQVNVVIHYYFVMKSLQVSVPVSYAFFAIPLIHFLLMLPISINGIGIRENAFIFLLVPMFTDEATAVAIAWVALAMVLVFALIGGAIHIFQKNDQDNRDT